MATGLRHVERAEVPLIQNLTQGSFGLGWTTCSTSSWSFTRDWSVSGIRYSGDYISVNRTATPVDFELSWTSIGHQRAIVPTNGVSLYPAGTTVHRSSGGAMQVAAMTLDRAAISTMLHLAPEDLAFAPMIGVADERLGWFIEVLSLEAARENSHRLFLESVMAAIALHLRRDYGRARGRVTATGGLAPRKRQRFIELVDAHLADDLSLTEAAADVGLSPSHFVHAFRASMGVTPRQYIIGRRVERAKTLLVETRDDLDTIAKAAGFSHASHLNRAFRQRVGTTPGRYRRRRGIYGARPGKA